VKQYGRLKLIPNSRIQEINKTLVRLKCDCGREIVVTRHTWENRQISECGCCVWIQEELEVE